jgi:hypothetical protein
VLHLDDVHLHQHGTIHPLLRLSHLPWPAGYHPLIEVLQLMASQLILTPQMHQLMLLAEPADN